MATLIQNYQTALKEFAVLTNKSAATLKSKGKSTGLAKLVNTFRSGKTLEQLIEAFTAVINDSERPNTDPNKATKALEAAFGNLNEGLKRNIAEYESQERDLGPSDAGMKDGFSVFLNRLEQIRKAAKISLVQRQTAMAKNANASTSTAEAAAELKQCYLTIKKGVEETEGSLKLFLARPTKENLKNAFCSSSNVRSIGAAVTMYKQKVLKKAPEIAGRLRADPVHLLTHIDDLNQNKGISYWEKQFAMDEPGWEDKAKARAHEVMAQMKNWRMLADELKAAGG